MRIEQAFLFLFGVGLLASPSSSPTAQTWNVLRQQAISAAQRGSFKEADALLRSAIKSLLNNENAAAVALWNDLGSVHQRGGEIIEAENDFNTALALNARLPKRDNGQAAVALNDLATIAGARHDPVRAENLLREAHREIEKAKDTEGPTAALMTGNLALTLQQEGRYSEAGPLYEQALAAVKARFGEKSIEYARTLTNLAWFQFQTGAYRKAVDSGELARSIQGSLPYVSDSERALTLNNLGKALTQVGSLAEAEAALLEAIRLERNMPNGKAQLVVSLNSLAGVEQKNGRLEAARNDGLQVLALKTQGVPVEDLSLASVLNTLGRIATVEHNFDEAGKRYARACELLEKASGPERVQYAATLSNMGALEMAQRHYKKAEALYRKALAIDESQLGPDHPAVATDDSNLAAQLFYQKRREEALEVYQRARAVVEASFGPVSLEAARLWHNLAVVYDSGKQFEQATAAYRRAVETLNASSAGHDPSLPSWLREYANTLWRAQRWAEAETVETRALGIEVRKAVAAQRQPGSATGGQQDRGKACLPPRLSR
jgi:tetratricopeptide (TPR) repeat protein